MPSFMHQIEAAIAALVTEPAFAAFGRADAGLLVWNCDGDRILWASEAAEPLRQALSQGRNGLAELPETDASRLRELAGGAAPRQGVQLERLRLNPFRYAAAPLTCVCRLIAIAGYGDVLVTALAGPVPTAAPAMAVRDGDRAISEPEPQPLPEPARLPEDRVERLRRQRTVRFVWQADADLRITEVSPALADAVGPRAADIVGVNWPQLLQKLPQQRPGAIAEHLARRETWSGETVFWPIDGIDQEVGVDLAGLPVYDDARRLTGYRGFGLCRGDGIRPLSHPVELREPPGPVVAPPLAPEPEAGLSESEKLSLREIARTLGGRVDKPRRKTAPTEEMLQSKSTAVPVMIHQSDPRPGTAPAGSESTALDLLPVGILIHRGEEVVFANRKLLDMVGYANVDRLAALGVAGLFRDSPVLTGGGRTEPALMLTSAAGEKIAVEVRLSSIEWNRVPASLMVIREAAETDVVEQLRRSERDNHERSERIRELESILATATDGIITLDETGRILSLNSSGEALFGYDSGEVAGEAITVLLAPESHMIALDYLDGLRLSGVASLLEGGREVVGKVKQGGTIPLFMTIGRISEGSSRKLCAVLRDITAFKKAERELLGAKRSAEEASEQKSDLLAKISHEIRTPLNAIIGFAEMMLEERFGPIGNERYKSYLKDMHTSGSHVMSLVNDLLDLAKIEAGHMDLTFTSVDLNDLVASCIGMMQQQASRGRIVMRTSFAHKLPPVVADERSVRQIVLNLVSNAIKFTDAGGQIIVSTAMTDRGEVVIRIRDTGIGMGESDIAAALEPFRQLATTRQRGGTGLGLPLTKALVEANRGSFEISSAPNEGTLVEVIFPPTRVLAE